MPYRKTFCPKSLKAKDGVPIGIVLEAERIGNNVRDVTNGVET